MRKFVKVKGDESIGKMKENGFIMLSNVNDVGLFINNEDLKIPKGIKYCFTDRLYSIVGD